MVLTLWKLEVFPQKSILHHVAENWEIMRKKKKEDKMKHQTRKYKNRGFKLKQNSVDQTLMKQFQHKCDCRNFLPLMFSTWES